ncbi:MAG: hypothetical protein V2I33_25330, partial [Kangiellaceae bacterium]|nr:hypothetical protein [Kangiellaceae bacterium]
MGFGARGFGLKRCLGRRRACGAVLTSVFSAPRSAAEFDPAVYAYTRRTGPGRFYIFFSST